MSTGPFEISKYTADDGSIYAIRIQPETRSLTIDGTANAAPAGAVDTEVRARVSGSRRGLGVFARVGRVRVTASGSSGLAVGRVITLPLLNGDVFDKMKSPNTGTYNTASVEAVGRSPEVIR